MIKSIEDLKGYGLFNSDIRLSILHAKIRYKLYSICLEGFCKAKSNFNKNKMKECEE